MRPHLTTRRGVVVGGSLSILSLYGLWAAYGAAPGLGLGGPGADGHADAGHDGGAATAAGHDGHGAGGEANTEAFRAAAETFIERYRLPDGSVQPPGPADGLAHAPAHAAAGHDGHGGHGGTAVPAPAHAAAAATPVEVYLLVRQWQFEPSVLRLVAGVPYRLRMLALDVGHGASLQLGAGSRIVRLRPGVPSEIVARFERPGEVLLYCTVYCGPGHDRMFGRIVVS